MANLQDLKRRPRKKLSGQNLNQAGMNGLIKYRHSTGVICLIVAGLFFVREVSAARAYLRVVGPPPLRFQAMTTNDFVYDPKLFSLEPKLAETVSNAVNQIAATATNADNSVAISPSVTNVNPVAVSPEIAADEGKNSAPHFNFNFATASASDLLTVTPQMITQYLKPEANATNSLDRPGAVVFVPAEMQFSPPTKITAVSRGIEGNESRATYQSQ